MSFAIAGPAALGVFVIGYALVMTEEYTGLRKSKPMVLAGGLIWAIVGTAAMLAGDTAHAEEVARKDLLEFAELGLFLLVAMTYINTLEERLVFETLRSRLTQANLSLRAVFWATGVLAFFLSPIADNLTTALLMCAVVMAVGRHEPRFVVLASINIVVAANAGGAFSPFGDITTLMVWQQQKVEFDGFLALFVPSVVNFLVPAVIMSFAVPRGQAEGAEEATRLRRGAWAVMALFLATIATAVAFHHLLGLPPVLGMLTGLGYLQMFGYYLRVTHRSDAPAEGDVGDVTPFDVFDAVARVEWDTLLFFYGVVMSVGALGYLGYLDMLSVALYDGFGQSAANIAIGVLSAIVDNIPVMFAVLTMDPQMGTGQWLLVTLTAGVGGSLLSIGSAAGIALMGQARGIYTFSAHLRWTPVIALGYAASIATHFVLNADLF